MGTGSSILSSSKDEPPMIMNDNFEHTIPPQFLNKGLAMSAPYLSDRNVIIFMPLS